MQAVIYLVAGMIVKCCYGKRSVHPDPNSFIRYLRMFGDAGGHAAPYKFTAIFVSPVSRPASRLHPIAWNRGG